jgi:hypothetical protein
MTDCLAEGTLRAYHDRELPVEEMEKVTAHLSACAACEGLADEVAGRAMRVQSLLGALPGPEQVIWMPRRTAEPVRKWPRWAAAAAAIAAGIVIALIWPGAKAPQTVALQPPAAVRELPPAPIQAPAPAREASMRLGPAVTARKSAARPKKPLRQVFLALDDEPIETGVVIRVALGDAGIPADVVFGPDGRAHAIRLVDTLTKY